MRIHCFLNNRFSYFMKLFQMNVIHFIWNTRLFETKKSDTHLENLLLPFHSWSFKHIYPGFDKQILENIFHQYKLLKKHFTIVIINATTCTHLNSQNIILFTSFYEIFIIMYLTSGIFLFVILFFMFQNLFLTWVCL